MSEGEWESETEGKGEDRQGSGVGPTEGRGRQIWGLGFSLIGVSRENEKFLEVGFNFLTVI